MTIGPGLSMAPALIWALVKLDPSGNPEKLALRVASAARMLFELPTRTFNNTSSLPDGTSCPLALGT